MTSVDKVSDKRKRKRKWKLVSVSNPDFLGGDMEGFVSLEVLDNQEAGGEFGGEVIRGSNENLESLMVRDVP